MTDNITNNDEGRKPEYTPRPWLFEFCEKSGTVYLLGKHADAVRTRQSDGLGYIFPLSVSMEGDENRYPEICPEQMANARLISAAPDLLEALQGLVHDLIDDFMAPMWEDCYNPDELPCVIAARAAIAKALGQ